MPVHRLSRVCKILHAPRLASDGEGELAAAGNSQSEKTGSACRIPAATATSITTPKKRHRLLDK